MGVFYLHVQLLSHEHLGSHTRDTNENACKFWCRQSRFMLRYLPSLVFSKTSSEKEKNVKCHGNPVSG